MKGRFANEASLTNGSRARWALIVALALALFAGVPAARAQQTAAPVHPDIGIQTAWVEVDGVQLYKLRGSVEQPESLLLTSDQYETFEQRVTTLLVLLVLQGYLARKTIVFLGYDLADPHFRRLYRKTIDPLDTYARQSYALFAEPPSQSVSLWCERRGIRVLQTEAVEFLETLLAQQAARHQCPQRTAIHSSLLLSNHSERTSDNNEICQLDFRTLRLFGARSGLASRSGGSNRRPQ